MQNVPATILFFGRPGAGKSTQAELLADHLRARGDRRVLSFLWSQVRDEFMRGNSVVQQRIQENHAAGKLQPKFFSVSIWGPLLLQQLTGDEHLVMDGIPRQAFEAEALVSALEFFERSPVLVINMDVPTEIARERMRSRATAEGRTDDASEESIQRRLDWFESDTLPILDTYRKDGRYRVLDIDGDRPREDLAQGLLTAASSLFTSDGVPARTSSVASMPPLIMGIGMPGAGKTTILKPLADRQGLTYVSRDEIRQELFGNPILQMGKEQVWEEAEHRVRESLAAGVPVVYDATFAEPRKRREFIKSMRALGWRRVIGLYVNTPVEVARERNRNRPHVVPEDQLEAHFIQPLTEEPPSIADGFDELYTLETADLLELMLAREHSTRATNN